MKKILTLIMVTTLLFGGCTKEEPTPQKNYIVETIEIDGEYYNKIYGTIDEELTFTSDTNWMLSGGVFVENTTLNIKIYQLDL